MTTRYSQTHSRRVFSEVPSPKSPEFLNKRQARALVDKYHEALRDEEDRKQIAELIIGQPKTSFIYRPNRDLFNSRYNELEELDDLYYLGIVSREELYRDAANTIISGGRSNKNVVGGYDPSNAWKDISRVYRLTIRNHPERENKTLKILVYFFGEKGTNQYDREQILNAIKYAHDNGLLRGHYAALQHYVYR